MENITDSKTMNVTKVVEAELIDVIYPLVLIITGVTFNILIIVVMRTRHFKEQSSSVYMTMGAGNDTLSLLVSMTTHWLHVSFSGIYHKETSGWICKFLDFYGWGNCDLSILLTTAMTVDRAIAITFPLKVASRNNIKRAKIAVTLVTLIVVAKEFHFLIGSDMVDADQTERLCNVFTTTESYRFFWKNVWPWLHFSFLLACFVVMTISNGVLIYSVWKSANDSKTNDMKQWKVKSGDSNGHPQKVDNKWRTITPMLIGESFALLILTFPFTVQTFISQYQPTFYATINPKLWFSLTFYMLYTNKCITFIIYLATGSRFRIALKECIIICFKGREAVRKKRFREYFLTQVNICKSVSEGGKANSISSKPRTQSNPQSNSTSAGSETELINEETVHTRL